VQLIERFARLQQRDEDSLVLNLLDSKVAAPNPDFLSYTLSKQALAALTDLAARALARCGTRVNGIAPGLMLRSPGQSEENFEAMHANNPLGRPVDPADVRKVVLEEPPGNLSLTDPKVVAARKTLFGAWETNWLAYNMAHDVRLPGSSGPAVEFLMYPQAEIAGSRLDSLDPEHFKYVITASEVTPT